MSTDDRVLLAHGNGGRLTRELIDELFVHCLKNPLLNPDADAARLDLCGELRFTTDAYTVQPLEFPGGNIGSLAVNGTVNDLAVSGAIPKYLSLSAVIEEGLEIALLTRLIGALGDAANTAGVVVVTGDTKVVPRGHGGGLYLTTSGVGVCPPGVDVDLQRIRCGDQLLVSGPVGDHGTTVLLAREDFGLHSELRSDCASVVPLTETLLGLSGLRFMRDPTRGGLASVCHEIARATGLSVRLDETAVPLRDPVRGVCDMLGFDPYYLACEGRVVAAVAAEQAATALSRWRALPQGADAAIIGELHDSALGADVTVTTEIGGERYLEELEDDPLPRIC